MCTVLAWLASLLHPLLRPAEKLFQSFLKLTLTTHAFAEAVVVLVSLLLLGVTLDLPRKLLRSLRLGLVAIPYWAWVFSVAAFWILLDAHHPRLAAVILTSAAILSAVTKAIGRSPLHGEGSGVMPKLTRGSIYGAFSPDIRGI